jgi:hypothetical protein
MFKERLGMSLTRSTTRLARVVDAGTTTDDLRIVVITGAHSARAGAGAAYDAMEVGDAPNRAGA